MTSTKNLKPLAEKRVDISSKTARRQTTNPLRMSLAGRRSRARAANRDDPADHPTEKRPVLDGGAGHVPGADDEIKAFLRLGEHPRHMRRVVGEVGVHDTDVCALGFGHTVKDRAGQAQLARTGPEPYTWIGRDQPLDHLAGAIGAGVVDNDDFNIRALEGFHQAREQDLDGLTLVVGGKDHGEERLARGVGPSSSSPWTGRWPTGWSRAAHRTDPR